jgi:hypothetical protein
MEDNKKIKIQIKSVFGDVLFEYEKENNTIEDTLKEAVRENANLIGAILSDAILSDANLSDANLSDAILSGTILSGANLSGANLIGANLSDANLSDAENIPYIPLACPSDGAFIGWKKVWTKSRYIVKLEIPEDAKRSSATTRKCRCDKAKVLDIINFDTKEHVEQVINESYNQETLYKVGEMVYPDKFDDNRWNECSNGIYFFINKQDAIDY